MYALVWGAVIRMSKLGERVCARQSYIKKSVPELKKERKKEKICSWNMGLKDGTHNISFSHSNNMTNGVLYSMVLLELQSIYIKNLNGLGMHLVTTTNQPHHCSTLWKPIWEYASNDLKSACLFDPVFNFQKFNPQISKIHSTFIQWNTMQPFKK